MTYEEIFNYIENEIVKATEIAFDNIESKFGNVYFTTEEHGDFANAQSSLTTAIADAVMVRVNGAIKERLEIALSNLSTDEMFRLHDLYVNGSEAYDKIYKMEDFNKNCEGLKPSDIAELTSSGLFSIEDHYYIENEEHGLYSFTLPRFGELPFDGMEDYIKWLVDEKPETGIEDIDFILKGGK